MIAFKKVITLALWCGLAQGCVVSTHEGVGVAPTIPLPKERAESETRAAQVARGPAEIAASHILIAYQGATRAAPYVQRTKEEALKLAQDLRGRAVKGEDFSALAGEFSDDRGSAAQGGSLGKFRREQMVPEFSSAAFALEVGDVSEVVESPFGFHVIRRNPDE